MTLSVMNRGASQMTDDAMRGAMRAARTALLLSLLAVAGCTSTGSVEQKVTTAAFNPGSEQLGSSKDARAKTPVHLTAYSSALPPAGFVSVCSRYPWACGGQNGSQSLSDAQTLALARSINRRVNHTIRSATDRSLYGKAEYWILPQSAGDCEDYALLKMKRLIEAGVPAGKLFLATALNRRSEHHVVLIIRTASADMVLDNLTSSIRPWQATGYTYLKRQNPTRKSQWQTVLLGPLASRHSGAGRS